VFTGLISAGWLLREVGRRKARKPATEAVNRPHRGFSAGELENPEATFDPCKCLAVFAGQTCLGHLLARGMDATSAVFEQQPEPLRRPFVIAGLREIIRETESIIAAMEAAPTKSAATK
jgi:hypothetical protein